ncbi:TPA: tRNA dihydrouridine synthase DusB [Candidatus Ventrenecus stercoripullorum]|nr:tRNA dihydrouridine synthase DusB [Candidatus Ventrenecus stercoripullorum]
MTWKIGNVEIKNQVVLAPMAGYSNTSFRKIIKDMGAGLIFAEMVSDKALVYQNAKTLELLKMSEEERPIAQQIFGSDVESFVEAARIVESVMHPDIIDINMGCPVPKVAVSAQAGSALLKNPDKIKKIVSEVVKAVSVPVTVKIRLGWDESSINCVEVAKVIESAGASAITLHARTRAQGYSGKARWEYIKQVKESVSIPVIGNGDVKTCFEAKRMILETGCDAVMIGRGVLGNPWIIRDCVEYLESGSVPKPVSNQEKIEMMKRHFELLKQDKNEKVALLEIRSNILFYLKGMPGNKEMKTRICEAKSEEDIYSLLNQYLVYLEQREYGNEEVS